MCVFVLQRQYECCPTCAQVRIRERLHALTLVGSYPLSQVSMLDNSNDSEVATVACSPTTPIIAPIKAMTSHDLVCDVLSRKFESWYVCVGGVCDGMTVDVTDPSKSAASS
jgi:hypothetical protein